MSWVRQALGFCKPCAFSSLIPIILVAVVFLSSTFAANAFDFDAFGLEAMPSSYGCAKETRYLIANPSKSDVTKDSFKLFLGALVSALRAECAEMTRVWFYVAAKDFYRPTPHGAFYMIEIDDKDRAVFNDFEYAFSYARGALVARDVWFELVGLKLRRLSGNEVASKSLSSPGWIVEKVVEDMPGEIAGISQGDIILSRMSLPALYYGESLQIEIQNAFGRKRETIYVPPRPDREYDLEKEREDFIFNALNNEYEKNRALEFNPKSVLDVYNLHPPVESHKLIHEDDEVALYENVLRSNADTRFKECNIKVPAKENNIVGGALRFTAILKNIDVDKPLNKKFIRERLLPHVRAACNEIMDFDLYIHAYPLVVHQAFLSGEYYTAVLDVSDSNYAEKLIDLNATGKIYPVAKVSIGLFGSHKKYSKRPSQLSADKWFINFSGDKGATSIRYNAEINSKHGQDLVRQALARKSRAKLHRELDKIISARVQSYRDSWDIRIAMLENGELSALRRFEAMQSFKRFSGSETRSLIRHFAMVMGDKDVNCGKPTKSVDITWNNVTEYYNRYGGFAAAPRITEERYAGTFLASLYSRLGSDAHVYINDYTRYMGKLVRRYGCGKRLDTLEAKMIEYLGTPVP